ncbi:histidine kinase N-terminal 7TM domain-containing protein [Natrinema halophilum]|uniref:histidine kinase n=1 Tax=Natrinema halophilum TaxID=1699371 RepID=A0A7D5L3E2_9EURY|nr:histidine kinase N-terminal 7TM domain-containing protein [Natrinema halophilum]QLG49285.1 ATP-binding protein [Natrinema halophilum]
MAPGAFDLLLILSLGITVIPTVYAWQLRGRKGGTPLFLILLSTIVWIVSALFASLASSSELVLLGIKGWFAGIIVVCPGFLFFALEYTGTDRYMTKPLVSAVVVHGVLAFVLVWVDPGRYFLTGLQANADTMSGYRLDYGLQVWLNLAVWYSYLVVGAVLMIRFIIQKRRAHRRQMMLILIGLVAPWTANVLFLFGPIATDFTPIGFAILGLSFTIAIARYQLVDMAPVAWETVINNISDSVFVLDAEDRIIDVNAVGARSYGLNRAEVVGTHASEVFSEYPEVYSRFKAATESEEGVEIPTKYGRRIIDLEVTPLFDDSGRELGRVFVAHDLTDQKRRQQELERQNERLDEFASLLSHDLRNPINVAQGYADVAMEEYDDPVYVAEMQTSLDRMETLVDDALTLARESQTITDPEPVSVEDVVSAAWRNVDTVDATIAVEADWQTVADRSRLLRIFENLIRNAIDHAGETVSITVGTIERDADSTNGLVEHGIYVADDGPGIPPEKRDEIFEHGHTTSDDGTGLGLSIVGNAVEAHGWDISVAESDDGGARFEIMGPTPIANGESPQATGIEAELVPDDSERGT